MATTLFLPYQLAVKLKRTNHDLYKKIVAQQTKKYAQSRENMPEFIYKYLFGKYFIKRQNMYTKQQNAPIKKYGFQSTIAQSCNLNKGDVPFTVKKMLIKLFKLCELLNEPILSHLISDDDSVCSIITEFHHDPQKTQTIKTHLQGFTYAKSLRFSSDSLPSGKYVGLVCIIDHTGISHIFILLKHQQTKKIYIFVVEKYQYDTTKTQMIYKINASDRIDVCQDRSRYVRMIDFVYKTISSKFGFYEII